MVHHNNEGFEHEQRKADLLHAASEGNLAKLKSLLDSGVTYDANKPVFFLRN
jgi:hypothetical protein